MASLYPLSKRKAQGIMIFILAISAFFVYSYLLMLSEWGQIVLQLSILMIVGGIRGVIYWIGYEMAKTRSSPSSIIQDDDN